MGNALDNFGYDSYTDELKLAALGYAGYTLRRHDRIGYTFFYARNASDTYQRREGEDSEGYQLTGSNNVTHIYTLQNHQLNGLHHFGERGQWELAWGGSYSQTGSEEPDRRQVMYVRNSQGGLSLFTLNQQETARYFGELNEDEWNACFNLKWKWSEQNFLKAGFNYKAKKRDYAGTRFYYDLRRLNPVIDNIYDTYGRRRGSGTAQTTGKGFAPGCQRQLYVHQCEVAREWRLYQQRAFLARRLAHSCECRPHLLSPLRRSETAEPGIALQSAR